MTDSFGARKSLAVRSIDYQIFRLDAVKGAVDTLPYTLKILLENMLRFEDGANITAEDITALANWDPAAEPDREISFTPARVVLQEGLQNAFARHARVSKMLTDGLRGLGLKLFGDQAHKMANVTGVHIPEGVDGDAVRRAMLEEHAIEIGTSFGPLHGRIWRIGTMGYNAREDAVQQTLQALQTVLASQKRR